MRPRIRMLGVVVAATSTFLCLAPASQADTSDPVWTCRGSLGYLFAPGQDPPNRLEPVLANGGTSTDPNNIERPQCADDESGFPEIVIGGEAGDPGRLSVQAPFARTSIDPDIGAARDQSVTAAGGAARVSLSDADGSFTLTADVTEASAAASCVNGAPNLTARSNVANIAINGMPLPLRDVLMPIVDGINGSPLVMLLRIDIDEEVRTTSAAGDQSLIRRALHVQLLKMDPNAPPVLEAVVGEARVGHRGAVCAPPEPPPACPEGTTEVGRQADGSVTCREVVTVNAPCPEGTTQDASGACVRVIVVQAPPEPAPPACPAGQVRNVLGACVTEPRSRCTGFGTGTPFLGTNGSDRITGTNRADRILAFGGRDRVSGGRGNDCVEGGSGNDNLDGSNGDDRLFGGENRDIMNGGTGRDRLIGDAGNDKLSGSSGNDRMEGGAGRDKLSGGLGKDVLVGGAGRDYIEGGPGADRVSAGTGDDVVNLSESGAGRDVVSCGPGNDVVRVDSRDRVARDCERVLVTIRRR